MLFALDQGFRATSLSSMTCIAIAGTRLSASTAYPAHAGTDGVQHLRTAWHRNTGTCVRVDIFRFQQAATLIMPKRAQRHIEHICNLALYGNSLPSPASSRPPPLPTSAVTRASPKLPVTLGATQKPRQIGTESRIRRRGDAHGNKVPSGNSLDARYAPGNGPG